MAGQSIERREVMRVLGLAAAASRFGGFEKWAYAGAHGTVHAGAAPVPYEPRFFSPEEYETVARLAELILPSDGTPGAREAGVSEFIDFMVASDAEVQSRFRYGLAWLDAHSVLRAGKPFCELSEAEQTAIFEPLAYKDRHRPGEEDGRAFFWLIRDYTVMGFYTSRTGMEQLGYPGLEFYSESPGCSDPEHRGLLEAQR